MGGQKDYAPSTPQIDEHSDPILRDAATALRAGRDSALGHIEKLGDAIFVLVEGQQSERVIALAWDLAGLVFDERVALETRERSELALSFLALQIRVGSAAVAARAMRAIASLARRYELGDETRGFDAAASYFDEAVASSAERDLQTMACGMMRAIELASGAEQLAPTLSERLRVPPSWFSEHFSAGAAELLAYAYQELLANSIERALLPEVAGCLENRGGVSATHAKEATLAAGTANGRQATLLRAMRVHGPLVTVRLGGMAYDSFVPIEGRLCWLGKLSLGPDAEGILAAAAAGHAAGFEPEAGAGQRGVAAWIAHIVARVETSVQYPSS